jgi:glycosyltransferase involved in cell wall biosynthesis
MRIVVLNWKSWEDSEAGGSELNAFYLCKYLISKGHDITYFCRKTREQKEKNLNKIDLILDKDAEKINTIRKGNRITTYLWFMLYYLISLRKKIDFIIDVHNGISWFTPMYSRKSKLLIVHHVVDKLWFKQKDPPFPFYIQGYIMEQWLMPFFYRKTKVLAVSPSTKEDLIKMGFKEKNIFVAYNGIADNLKSGEKSKEPLLIYLGRIEKYKNIEKFIDLCIDLKIQGEIIGQGRYLDELKKYASEKDAHKYISFRGFVSENEKIKAYQKAWAFVMPSNKEGWGITSIEANRCGTPVIAFNVEGLRDSIKNGESGFLVNSYDEMKKKTEELINNEKLRKKLEKNSVKWSKRFTWNAYGERVLKEIDKIAEKSC